MSQIDARGLSCPQPVVLTKNAIKSGNKNFEVLVDSEVSKENVIRCVESSKLKADVKEDGESFIITVTE